MGVKCISVAVLTTDIAILTVGMADLPCMTFYSQSGHVLKIQSQTATLFSQVWKKKCC